MKKLMLATVGAVALLASSPAMAAPVVYLEEVEGIWIDTDPTVTGEGSNKIEWGTPAGGAGRSGYEFNGEAPPETGPFDLESDFAVGTFTHNNFPITGTTLNTATLQVSAKVRFENGGVNKETIISNFDFVHNETVNNANPCANGQPNGSDVNVNGCADQVTFAFNPTNSVGVDVYDDGVFYGTYFLGLSGFNFGGSPATTFWTVENRSNVATLTGRVTLDPAQIQVPEPGTLALLGIGLLGAGFAARRRHAAS